MEKSYEWEIHNFDEWKITPNVEYINQCCEFCDAVLYKIKDALCEKLEADKDKIEIGQEDWGWYLLLEKDGIFYELDISFLGNGNNYYQFGVILEVKKMKKVLFFNLETNAEPEKLFEFDEVVNEVAKLSNIKISA